MPTPKMLSDPAILDRKKLSPLTNARLIVALDALLREGSVSRAADSCGIQVSGMSRLLAEIRGHFGDEILVRTANGMRPTPFAEALRNKTRLVAAQLEELLSATASDRPDQPSASGNDWTGETQWKSAPLAARSSDPLLASPTPVQSMMHLSAIGDNDEPSRRLAKYVGTIGPGPGRSRPLSIAEAEDALAIVLRGEADPLQIGALLVTMEYRGPTALELAGFVQAIRQESSLAQSTGDRPDLDWPTYVSPRWREAPWFMHSARLVASAGFSVLLHGSFGQGPNSGKFEQAARDAAIAVAASVAEARQLLSKERLVYLPLGAMAPQVQSLLGLHSQFQMRSPVNACVNMINPLGAPATVVGAASDSRRSLFRELAQHLDTPQILVVGSTRDLAQLRPDKSSNLYRRLQGMDQDLLVPRRPLRGPEPNGLLSQREYFSAVWSGAARDEHAEETIIRTAAAALLALSDEPSACFEDFISTARALWLERDTKSGPLRI